MNISKTTLNFASRRNIDLFINDGQILDISVMDGEGCTNESSVQYLFFDDELFFYKSFNSNLEDLPNWIQDEKQLRQVIQYISEVTA